jgi:hypothetical protein
VGGLEEQDPSAGVDVATGEDAPVRDEPQVDVGKGELEGLRAGGDGWTFAEVVGGIRHRDGR